MRQKSRPKPSGNPFQEVIIQQMNTDHALSALLFPEWQRERSQLHTRFDQRRQPFLYLRQHSRLADNLIETLWEQFCSRFPKHSASACLIAIGGYGRRELYPYSDLDLLLLCEKGALDAYQPIATELWQSLWDMKIRPAAHCHDPASSEGLARSDHAFLTALLDRRFITGNKELYHQFDRSLQEILTTIPTSDCVEAKLEERQLRLEKHGASRFLLEPDIKENAGGLRDLHTLYWLARFYYATDSVSQLVRLGKLQPAEYRRFRRAHHFLATVRIQLHYMAGRADERLTFDKQKQLGEWLGFRSHEAHLPVERFMKRYFQTARHVSNLTRIFSALLEEELRVEQRSFFSRLFERERTAGAFTIRGKRLNLAEDVVLEDAPHLMLSYFALAQEEELGLHPEALQRISRQLPAINQPFRRSAEANALFLSILLSRKQPDLTLTRLNDAGVLGKFLPDFAYLIGQIQYDGYHVYTVDEHTIRVIRQLNLIETGALKDELPIASEIMHQITSRRALFVAALCHDIAKGRGGDHARQGVNITRRLCKRFRLDRDETELSCWLVEHHLLFSHTAFSRDLDDPQTLTDLIKVVQSPERLKCLLLLTIADIRAVGPSIWNGWKGALLRALYQRADAQMGSSHPLSRQARIDQARRQLLPALKGWPDTDRAQLLEEGAAAFWLGIPATEQAAIAGLIRNHWQGKNLICFEYAIHSFEAITRLKLVLPDHKGLLHALAGCITRIGGSIAAIRSVTLRDGLAVLLVDIQSKLQTTYEDEEKLATLPELLTNAFRQPHQLDRAVEARRPRPSSRKKALHISPAIYISSAISSESTVIEINATDRIGLLYDITAVLMDMALDIHSSHIVTYGEKAVDVFYVKDMLGQKITHPDTVQSIRQNLLAMLAYRDWSTT